MIKRKLIAEQPFEFSPRVTLQLGRESISSSTVAISELIKNSYDADADHVSLDFHLRENGVSTLIIEDNGFGMNPDTLVNHWLRIGTDNKSIVERSIGKQRILTGAKGLGRLGIDRLCKRLILYTKTKEMEKAVQLNINWRQFENTKKTLSEIKHQIFEVDFPISDRYGTFLSETGNSSGTRMILLGLKDEWNSSFLDTLENELRLLTSPFQGENQFAIRLRVQKKNEVVEKSVSSEAILSAARWRVKATVDQDGHVSASFINNQKGIEITQDPLPWNHWLKNSGTVPLFGPVTFEFYYLAQDAENLTKLNLKVRNFREFMRLNQGVRLYRDYFRVRPYGEPSGKGDWLDLGLRKVGNPQGVSQPGWKIGPNQIVGAVLISRSTNAILNDQANREGIVENSAFFQLRTFLLKVIDTFETLVQKDASGEKNLDLSHELARLLAKSNEDLELAIDDLKKTVVTVKRKKHDRKKKLLPAQIVTQRLAVLDALRKKQSEAEERYLEALRIEKNDLEEQKNTLSNLASIGILAISFGHEVRQHSGLALNGTIVGLGMLEKLKSDDPILPKILKSIQIAREGAQYVDNFSRFAIENIKPDKRKRKKVVIKAVFDHVFNMFSVTLDKMNIDRVVRVAESNIEHSVFAFEIDWESIAINFMTNSIWAIEAKENRERSEIIVDISSNEENLSITYSDSGVGLEVGSESSIFLPMNSGKRDRIGNVIGTGMGLAIVKTHVENHMGGKISAKAHGDLGGAEFRIEIPLRGAK